MTAKAASQALTGTVERITYSNPENGYTVAKISSPHTLDLITIVGDLTMLQVGERVRCFGEWAEHLVHGEQFEVAEYQVDRPVEIEAITKYLGSGLISGIGPGIAARIVAKFGKETLDILDSTPKKLLTVSGIGKSRLDSITSSWREQRAIREIMAMLQQFQISCAYAQRILRIYGKESIEKVRENPYRLAIDIPGVGFHKADEIARAIGLTHESSFRLQAGVTYSLRTHAQEGDVCCPYELLVEETAALLSVPEKVVQTTIEAMHRERELAIRGEDSTLFVYLPGLFQAEQSIVKEITRLLNTSCTLRKIDTDKAIQWASEKLGRSLAPKQAEAVANALKHNVYIITGGPGTGKSTITHTILTIIRQLTPHIACAAPTGRAAKRMTEITGFPAKTLHSLLEFDFRAGGFTRGRDNPLEQELLIIDEASMIDTRLMAKLCEAIPSGARVIFVGDINQLPSVGPGNVLRDLIASKRVPVTGLTEIFRQAKDSRITVNAHLINQGELPQLENDPSSDFFFLEEDDPESIRALLSELVTTRLPKHYSFDPIHDIQVLSPMKKGPLGTIVLNELLQKRLNPQTALTTIGGRQLYPGDRVMQIRNDYQKEVFNGDTGQVLHVDLSKREVTVEVEGRALSYRFSELDDLVLAYAVSIHKSQGSEYPCVVIPLHTTHFKLLHKNLLYTGLTRAKRLALFVGSRRALSIAVKNDEVHTRYTGLREALCQSTKL